MVSPTGPTAATYFTELQVCNIRCFGPEPQTLNLSDEHGTPARWTVLLGNNGTGKTTILQCLAGFDPSATERGSGGLAYRWAMGLFRHDSSLPGVYAKALTAQSLNEAVTSPQDLSLVAGWGSKNGRHLDIWQFVRSYGYGVTRRLGASSVAPNESADGCATLFAEDANLTNAEEWLLRMDYSASKASEIQERQTQRLAQVKDLLKAILPEVSDIRFSQPTVEQPTPVVEFETPYGWVDLKQLGQGYRTLIAWMVDFASRMVDRYPDSASPLAEPAVVLVDEIDLHLHPSWQRKLIDHLSNLFPNTQFIATAHSPLIVLSAGDANIALLRREGDHVIIDNDVERIRNWRVDQILTSDLFGLDSARPPQLDPLMKRRDEILGQPALSDSDRAELDRIEQQIGQLPGGETEAEARRMLEMARETQELIKKYGG